jgi:hypothetical protein
MVYYKVAHTFSLVARRLKVYLHCSNLRVHPLLFSSRVRLQTIERRIRETGSLPKRWAEAVLRNLG